MTSVPLADLARSTSSLRDELLSAVDRVLSSAQYILGEEVDLFEKEIGAYLGARHCIGVASGTDAIWLALKALDIGPGDRVLTSPLTFFATASAILNTGAEPVFADIDPVTLNIHPSRVRAALEEGSAIRAVVPVHLYGRPADMDDLLDICRSKEIPVVEDAAQALGAEYRSRKAGTLGRIGCFSFFPTKNLGGFGDGGLVATDDDVIADRIRLLRGHGARPKYHHHVVGTNSRLDSIHAAMLRVMLPHLDRLIGSRRAAADRYDRLLSDLDAIQLPAPRDDVLHPFHQYTIRVRDGRRDALNEHLGASGVGTAIYYAIPLHLQPALRDRGYERKAFPEAEAASREVLSLPIFPGLTEEEQIYVSERVHDFFVR